MYLVLEYIFFKINIDIILNCVYNFLMKNFYIFLDVDGVLFDYAWIKKNNKNINTMQKFKKESIDALNYLIQSLEKKYNIDLVIISAWRVYKFELLNNMLNKSGLKYNNDIHKTKDSNRPFIRGKEIKDYLKRKKNANNYVIIDDENFDYDKYFDKNRIIKPNIIDNALNMKMVQKFLDYINDNTNELCN